VDLHDVSLSIAYAVHCGRVQGVSFSFMCERAGTVSIHLRQDFYAGIPNCPAFGLSDNEMNKYANAKN
jgi:hypothetical protein